MKTRRPVLLFVQLTTFLFKMLGVGLAGASLFARGFGRPQNPSLWICWVGIFAILVQYLLFLIGLTVAQVSWVCWLFSVLGWICVWRDGWVGGFPRPLRWGLGLCVIFLLVFLLEPNDGGDGRLIWFAHAKMMAHFGSLWIPHMWTSPVFDFSHLDYPKPISTLAAHVSYAGGVWNEYWPRLALIFAVIPCVFGFLSFSQPGWFFPAWMLLCFISTGESLWLGMQDAFLSLLAVVAVLCLRRFLCAGGRVDLGSALLALALVACLKNEGMLLALVILFVFAMHLVFARAQWSRLYWSDLGWAFVLALPTVMWQVLRHVWGVHNDLFVGATSTPMQLAQARLSSPQDLVMIARHMLNDNGLLYALGVLAVGFWFCKKSGGPQKLGLSLLLGVAGLYWLAMFCIYLLTPLDLEWHLSTSADRTTAPALLMVLTAIYRLVEDAWRASGRQRIDGAPPSPVPHGLGGQKG